MLTQLGNWELENLGVPIFPSGVMAWESNTLAAATSHHNPGTSSTRSSAIVAAYVGDSFERDVEFTWEPGVGNFTTGIGSIGYWTIRTGGGSWTALASFDPKIGKGDTQRLVLECRCQWARH
jgi:hypothetical protein